MGVIMIILIFIMIICGIVASVANQSMEEQHKKNIEMFGEETANEIRRIAIDRANGIKEESDAPWGVHYYDHLCPYCGKRAVRDADWDDKKVSVAFWGAASDKIATRYKCDACKRMFK